MSKRFVSLVALAAAILSLAIPSAAAAAPQPWWQIVTGSRPSNLWIPQNEVQQLQKGSVITKVFLEGNLVACIGGFCGFLGQPNSEAPADLQAALEAPGAYGPGNVEVAEEPAGSGRYLITSIGEDAGRAVSGLSAEDFVAQDASVKVIVPGGSGRLVVTLSNIGDAAVDASKEPLEIRDEMPAGVVATGVEARAGNKGSAGPVDCEVKAGDLVSCSFGGILPPYEAIEIETYVKLEGDPPVSGAPGQVTVSGGNAEAESDAQPLRVGEQTSFGIEYFSTRAEEEGGEELVRAGAHPFQVTTTIQFNAGAASGVGQEINVKQPAMPRNFRFPLPAGLVGDVDELPQCTLNQFFVREGSPFEGGEAINQCPDSSAIGVAAVTFTEPRALGYERRLAPVFNLAPGPGEPARFGFVANGLVPVIVDTAVDPDHGYRLIASVSNTTQLAAVLSSTLSLWGTPGDPAHDSSRGWSCVDRSVSSPCQRPSGLFEGAFLRAPVSCEGPLVFDAEVEPWNTPAGSVVAEASSVGAGLHSCNQVPFDPSISATPTSKLASSPSGLDFQLAMPNANLNNSEGIAEAQPKKVEVTLPEGVTINPSAGEGLAGCTPAEYAQERFDSGPGEGCPEASKIGSVRISTPLLNEEAIGAIYEVAPYDNPSNSLLGLYMIAKIPDRGILIKQAGKVEPDPQTGQLLTTFENLPQLPFSSFQLHFREGARAPLVMPPTCGTFQIEARLVPWSAQNPDNPSPDEVVSRTSPFTIDQGVNGSTCPGGTPPFKPGLSAGTENNAAGSYSPFKVRLTRNDDEQEFRHFSLKLPKGVIGNLSGIPFCSETAIAQARSRTGADGAQEELARPSCPAASQVGRTLVGAGVGRALTYVPGSLYLAGPYQGAKLSFVAITPAKVGPFDLGNVVIRQALKVNPINAEVSTDGSSSDPIPHILQGIVVHARDIRVFVDRKNFVLNPTSCERMTVAAAVIGSGLDFGSAADDQVADVTSPFQAADCASLGFKPKLSLKLRGGTRRGAHPSLRAVLKARKGDANIGAAQVTLPHSEFLDQAHIRTICTRVQFAAGSGNGSQCPKGAVYGQAKAVSPLLDEPLVGRVYLRSSNHALPDLVAALHSKKVDINLVGRIDSVNGGIRNTFEAVPDAPVTKFVLEMQGGKKGLLVNSTDICLGKHRAKATFTGQNGKRRGLHPLVKARCGGKQKRRSKH